MARFNLRLINSLDQVRPGLFISSAQMEQEPELLVQHGITHVLQAGTRLRPHHLEQFVYHHMQLEDAAGDALLPQLPAALQFIEEARQTGGVLVHCQRGVSRSASVVCSYLMWKENLTWEEALQQLQAARSIVDPKPFFRQQLQMFQELGCQLDTCTTMQGATEGQTVEGTIPVDCGSAAGR